MLCLYSRWHFISCCSPHFQTTSTEKNAIDNQLGVSYRGIFLLPSTNFVRGTCFLVEEFQKCVEEVKKRKKRAILVHGVQRVNKRRRGSDCAPLNRANDGEELLGAVRLQPKMRLGSDDRLSTASSSSIFDIFSPLVYFIPLHFSS